MKGTRAIVLLGWLARMLGTAVVVAGAVACSSINSSSVAPTTDSSRAHFDASNCPASVVYVVSAANRSIEIYDRARLHAGPCGSVTGFQSPQGLFVDSKGSLWVADAMAQKVFVFVPGSKTAKSALTDPYGVPNAVAVDETTGTAYVTVYKNNVNPNTLVEVYASGSTTPTGSLSDTNARNGAFDAVDNQGNLYVTFMTQKNKAQVDRWMSGAGNPQNLGLELVSAGAIVTTVSSALAICDPFAFRCGEFAAGSKEMTHVFGHIGRAGSVGVTPDKRPFLHPDALALDRAERRAYVAAGSVTEWTFPGPKYRPGHLPLVEIKIPGGAGSGIAVNPASGPGTPY